METADQLEYTNIINAIYETILLTKNQIKIENYTKENSEIHIDPTNLCVDLFSRMGIFDTYKSFIKVEHNKFLLKESPSQYNKILENMWTDLTNASVDYRKMVISLSNNVLNFTSLNNAFITETRLDQPDQFFASKDMIDPDVNVIPFRDLIIETLKDIKITFNKFSEIPFIKAFADYGALNKISYNDNQYLFYFLANYFVPKYDMFSIAYIGCYADDSECEQPDVQKFNRIFVNGLQINIQKNNIVKNTQEAINTNQALNRLIQLLMLFSYDYENKKNDNFNGNVNYLSFSTQYNKYLNENYDKFKPFAPVKSKTQYNVPKFIKIHEFIDSIIGLFTKFYENIKTDKITIQFWHSMVLLTYLFMITFLDYVTKIGNNLIKSMIDLQKKHKANFLSYPLFIKENNINAFVYVRGTLDNTIIKYNKRYAIAEGNKNIHQHILALGVSNVNIPFYDPKNDPKNLFDFDEANLPIHNYYNTSNDFYIIIMLNIEQSTQLTLNNYITARFNNTLNVNTDESSETLDMFNFQIGKTTTYHIIKKNNNVTEAVKSNGPFYTTMVSGEYNNKFTDEFKVRSDQYQYIVGKRIEHLSLFVVNKIDPKYNFYFYGPFTNIFTGNEAEKNDTLAENINTFNSGTQSINNLVLFAYGASGAGKTSKLIKLMTKDQQLDGIVPYLASQRFGNKSITVKIAELYCNSADDTTEFQLTTQIDSTYKKFTHNNNNQFFENSFHFNFSENSYKLTTIDDNIKKIYQLYIEKLSRDLIATYVLKFMCNSNQDKQTYIYTNFVSKCSTLKIVTYFEMYTNLINRLGSIYSYQEKSDKLISKIVETIKNTQTGKYIKLVQIITNTTEEQYEKIKSNKELQRTVETNLGKYLYFLTIFYLFNKTNVDDMSTKLNQNMKEDDIVKLFDDDLFNQTTDKNAEINKIISNIDKSIKKNAFVIKKLFCFPSIVSIINGFNAQDATLLDFLTKEDTEVIKVIDSMQNTNNQIKECLDNTSTIDNSIDLGYFLTLCLDSVREISPTPNNIDSSRSHVFAQLLSDNQLIIVGDFAGIENSFNPNGISETLKESFNSQFAKTNNIETLFTIIKLLIVGDLESGVNAVCKRCLINAIGIDRNKLLLDTTVNGSAIVLKKQQEYDEFISVFNKLELFNNKTVIAYSKAKDLEYRNKRLNIFIDSEAPLLYIEFILMTLFSESYDIKPNKNFYFNLLFSLFNKEYTNVKNISEQQLQYVLTSFNPKNITIEKTKGVYNNMKKQYKEGSTDGKDESDDLHYAYINISCNQNQRYILYYIADYLQYYCKHIVKGKAAKIGSFNDEHDSNNYFVWSSDTTSVQLCFCYHYSDDSEIQNIPDENIFDNINKILKNIDTQYKQLQSISASNLFEFLLNTLTFVYNEHTNYDIEFTNSLNEIRKKRTSEGNYINTSLENFLSSLDALYSKEKVVNYITQCITCTSDPYNTNKKNEKKICGSLFAKLFELSTYKTIDEFKQNTKINALEVLNLSIDGRTNNSFGRQYIDTGNLAQILKTYEYYVSQKYLLDKGKLQINSPHYKFITQSMNLLNTTTRNSPNEFANKYEHVFQLISILHTMFLSDYTGTYYDIGETITNAIVTLYNSLHSTDGEQQPSLETINEKILELITLIYDYFEKFNAITPLGTLDAINTIVTGFPTKSAPCSLTYSHLFKIMVNDTDRHNTITGDQVKSLSTIIAKYYITQNTDNIISYVLPKPDPNIDKITTALKNLYECGTSEKMMYKLNADETKICLSSSTSGGFLNKIKKQFVQKGGKFEEFKDILKQLNNTNSDITLSKLVNYTDKIKLPSYIPKNTQTPQASVSTPTSASAPAPIPTLITTDMVIRQLIDARQKLTLDKYEKSRNSALERIDKQNRLAKETAKKEEILTASILNFLREHNPQLKTKEDEFLTKSNNFIIKTICEFIKNQILKLCENYLKKINTDVKMNFIKMYNTLNMLIPKTNRLTQRGIVPRGTIGFIFQSVSDRYPYLPLSAINIVDSYHQIFNAENGLFDNVKITLKPTYKEQLEKMKKQAHNITPTSIEERFNKNKLYDLYDNLNLTKINEIKINELAQLNLSDNFKIYAHEYATNSHWPSCYVFIYTQEQNKFTLDLRNTLNHNSTIRDSIIDTTATFTEFIPYFKTYVETINVDELEKIRSEVYDMHKSFDITKIDYTVQQVINTIEGFEDLMNTVIGRIELDHISKIKITDFKIMNNDKLLFDASTLDLEKYSKGDDNINSNSYKNIDEMTEVFTYLKKYQEILTNINQIRSDAIPIPITIEEKEKSFKEYSKKLSKL